MIFVFVAPTPTGVLLSKNDLLPSVKADDDCSISTLMVAVTEEYGADLQLLIPVGSFHSQRIIGVGEVYEQGTLRSLPPPNNEIDLIAALVRGGLSNWRVDGSDNDFSIKFLGS